MGNIQTKKDAGWTIKNPRFRSASLSLISLGIVAAFVYYLYINADKFLSLLRISPLSVVLILLLSLTTPFLSGTSNVYMGRALGANLSFREGFLLAAVSTLANQLPVSGGIVTKGIYLKHKHALAYTIFISAMLAILFCTFAVYGLLGLGILLYWVLFKNATISPVLFAGFGGMAACLVIFWLPLERIKISAPLLKWVHHALEGWLLISKNPLLILKLLIIQTSMMLLMALRYWLAFRMLSQDVTISQVILFSCATILTNLVSFAPGGLGVREAIVGGIASALGFDIGVSMVAVGLDRLISTVMIVLIGWTSTVILGKQLSETSLTIREQEV